MADTGQFSISLAVAAPEGGDRITSQVFGAAELHSIRTSLDRPGQTGVDSQCPATLKNAGQIVIL